MKGFRILLPYIIGISLFLITGWAYAATFIVDSLEDVDNGLPYTPGDSTNTLRKCIRLANETPGADTINFSLSGTISPTSALPAITDDGTVIDASSQWIGTWPSGQPGITLDGSGAGDTHGLVIFGADNCHIRGLFITNFWCDCVLIHGAAQFNSVGGIGEGYRNVLSGSGCNGVDIQDSSNNVISGNYIGTDVTGTVTLRNSHNGVIIQAGARFNMIGGINLGEKNIISGNAHNGVIINNGDDNKIYGNYIGTDVSGTLDLGNGGGIFIGWGAQSNIIGGTTESEKNIISGNNSHGVCIGGLGTNNNVVSGNYIGTDVSGTANLGNSEIGVGILEGAQSNTIGGTAPGEGNIIAFNGGHGIEIMGIDTDYNRISHNAMHDNWGGGIDLVDGGNDEIPAPIITSNNLVGDTLIVSGNGAGANATVEIFKADSFESGEGMTYLGSLTANADGNFSGSIDVTGKGLAVGDPLVATTTHTSDNTSEFSAPPVPVEGPPPMPQVVEVWPEPGATAKRETKIYAVFSKPMDESTLTASTIRVEGTKSGVVNGSITYEPDISRVVFTPGVLFASNEQITVTLTGDIKDTEGNGLDGDRDGISEGSPEDDFRWEFSTMPHALSVDGVNDYVGWIKILNNITNNFTMELWVDPFSTHEIDTEATSGVAGVQNQKYVIGAEYGGDGYAGAGISVGTNGVSVYEHAGGYMPPLLVWQGNLSGWTHIAVVYNNKQPCLYVNGSLVRIGLTSPKDFVFPGVSNGIGGGLYGYFKGFIDEVRIWDIARTQKDIQATMNTTLKGNEPGLVGYWNFDDSTANDSSPYGNHGTLMGDADIIPLVGTWPPKKIGDVSGNGTISAYDAALILQYVVGLISEFPADLMGSPSTISPRSYIVRIPEISAKAGDRIQVPIAINDATGLFAGGISLKYDRAVLRAIKALPDMVLNGSYWKANTELEGEVRFAFATTEVVTTATTEVVTTVGKVDLLMVEFEVLPNAEGKTSRLIIDNVNLSNSLNITKINGSVTVIPSAFALLQNYPNPFNPDTWIPFKIATDASVTINIYNQKGQLIRTIALGQRTAGMYLSKDRAAYWDGRDNSGEKVSSGVYFYSLRAGEFIATRKLVVVK